MRRETVVTAALVVVHVAAAAWIAVSYRRRDDLWLLAVSSLPLAQASLVAAWGASSRGFSYLRAPAVVAVLTLLWAVRWNGLGLDASDRLCAAYAMMFTVQAVLIAAVPAAIRLCSRPFRRRDRPEARERLQFGLRSILVWIATAALMLGAWRSVLILSGSPAEVVKDKFFPFGAVVGAYNALLAMIAWLCVWWGPPRHILVRILPGAVLVCVVAVSQPLVLKAAFGTDGQIGPASWVIQAGFQSLFLLVTWIPLRLCRYRPFKEPVHGSSSDLATPSAGVPEPA